MNGVRFKREEKLLLATGDMIVNEENTVHVNDYNKWV